MRELPHCCPSRLPAAWLARNQFTVTERLAIAEAIQAGMGERNGKRPDATSGNISGGSGDTRDLVAKQTGFGCGKTLEAAKTVIANGAPELVAAMVRKVRGRLLECLRRSCRELSSAR